MTKILLTLSLIATTVCSFSQTAPIDLKTKEYYLTKSSHQKTIGWIMLGSGIALTGIGIGVASAETIDYALGNSKSGNAGSVLAIAGIASALGSIPLFISAGHNKHRAASMGFNMQKTPLLLPSNQLLVARQPALTIKIVL